MRLAAHERARAERDLWNNRRSPAVEKVHFEIEEFEIQQYVKGSSAMFRLAKAIKSRRESIRTRKALEYAISNAATPSMRDELIMVGQRTDAIR